MPGGEEVLALEVPVTAPRLGHIAATVVTAALACGHGRQLPQRAPSTATAVTPRGEDTTQTPAGVGSYALMTM